MNELQIKYKILILFLSLVTISPIFFAASNKETLAVFMETTNIVQEAAKHYNIDINECLKCQEDGWKFATISIVLLVSVIIASFTAVLILLAVLLSAFAGWSFSFTIKTLLLGKYPDKWKVTST